MSNYIHKPENHYSHFIKEYLKTQKWHLVVFLVAGIITHFLLIHVLEYLFVVQNATKEIVAAKIENATPATGTVNSTNDQISLPVTLWTSIVKDSSPVQIKSWAIGIIDIFVGVFSFLLSYFLTTVKDRHTHTFLSLRSAVDNFLNLTNRAYSVEKSGATEQRFAVFVQQFNAKTEPLKSFAEVGYNEQSRLIALLSRSCERAEEAPSYHDQIRIASILCAQGRSRFWAVSTDPTLVFHRENAHYYQALDDAADNYRRSHKNMTVEEGPPYLCRIFLCPQENLDYSLELYALDFLEMYRRHILWAELPDSQPIKFLFGNPSEWIKKVGGKEGDLEDFMVVDHDFVYGRQGGYAKHSPKLRTLTSSQDVDRYAEIFKMLFANAMNIIEILDGRIAEEGTSEPMRVELKNLKSLCHYIKQKGGNKALYGLRFNTSQRHGTGFFERICQLIQESEGDIIAVDVADKKVNHFYRAWLSHPSYKKFREAGKRATESGKHLKRLFILKNKLNAAHANEIEEFLIAFLRDGAEIAFVSEAEAKVEFKEERYSVDFELDFLLGGIPEKFITTTQGADTANHQADEDNFRDQAAKTHAFGFELFGNEPFVEEMLEWERNLVDLGGMYRKIQCFNRLWAAVGSSHKSAAVRKTDDAAVAAEAARLKEELLKMNTGVTT